MDNDIFINILEELMENRKNSDFYNLSEQERILEYFRHLHFYEYELDGGLIQCERKTLKLNESNDLKALKMVFPVKSCFSHSDILGSVLSLGIDRRKTGDIVINGNAAYMVVKQEVASYLYANLMKVGKISVTVEVIETDEIKMPEAEEKEITVNVSSLRLDCVLSGGFHLARNKSIEYIKGQKVSVNHMLSLKGSTSLKEGDIISLKGKGRLVLKGIGNVTKKGRLNIKVIIQH